MRTQAFAPNKALEEETEMELWAHPHLWGCHPKTGGRWEPEQWVERDIEG